MFSDGAVILWRLTDKEHKSMFGDEEEFKEVWAVSLILRLVTQTDMQTNIHDTNQPKTTCKLKPRDKSEDIYDLSWSADSTQLAVASIDNTTRIWDAQKGKKEIFLRSC